MSSVARALQRARSESAGNGDSASWTRDDEQPQVNGPVLPWKLPPAAPSRVRRRTDADDTRSSLPTTAALLIAVLAGLVGAILLGRTVFLRSSFETAQAAQLPGSVFIGTIRPAAELAVSTTGAGIVRTVLVKVGDTVQVGQSLMTIDDPRAVLALEQAERAEQAATRRLHELRADAVSLERTVYAVRLRATLAAARVAMAQRQAEQVPLRQMRDSPERAQLAAEQANRMLSRMRSLHEQGVIARAALDDAEAAALGARDDAERARTAARAADRLAEVQQQDAEARAALVRSETIQNQRELSAQIASARADLERLAAQARAARQRTDALTVRATATGVVSSIAIGQGSPVVEGTLAMRMADIRRLYVDVEVAARIVNAIVPGQIAEIALPTSPVRRLQAPVSAVSPIPTERMTHTVRLEFDNPTGMLLAGQPAEVAFRVR